MTMTAPPFRTVPSQAAPRGMKFGILIGVAVGIAVAAVVVGLVAVTRHSNQAVTVGSGVSRSETRVVTPFGAIELAGANTMTIHVGEPQHVVVSADSNLLDHVVTKVRSGVLIVSNHGRFTTHSPMSVFVSVPRLGSATLSGTGELTVDGVAGRAFIVQLSGTGTLTASGSVDRLDASVDGTGALKLASLVSRDVSVAMHGTGTVTVYATRSLHASLVGTGDIIYSGHPKRVATNVTGTGQITAK